MVNNEFSPIHIKLQCVFMLVDFGNNEFFIYLGKDGTLNQYKSILTIAEVFLNRKPYLKVS